MTWLAGGLASALAAPLFAQEKPVDLAAHIRGNAPQEYVLARCAGFYKALMMGNADQSENALAAAKSTIDWFFNGIIAVRGQQNEGDIEPIVQRTAAEIEDHAQFYLDRLLFNIGQTGQPSDELMAMDQKVCLLIAKERATR